MKLRAIKLKMQHMVYCSSNSHAGLRNGKAFMAFLLPKLIENDQHAFLYIILSEHVDNNFAGFNKKGFRKTLIVTIIALII